MHFPPPLGSTFLALEEDDSLMLFSRALAFPPGSPPPHVSEVILVLEEEGLRLRHLGIRS